ncbi:MAG: hypothetical protein WCC59_00175, partial [Terriglobales bacterium]
PSLGLVGRKPMYPVRPSQRRYEIKREDARLRIRVDGPLCFQANKNGRNSSPGHSKLKLKLTSTAQ